MVKEIAKESMQEAMIAKEKERLGLSPPPSTS